MDDTKRIIGIAILLALGVSVGCALQSPKMSRTSAENPSRIAAPQADPWIGAASNLSSNTASNFDSTNASSLDDPFLKAIDSGKASFLSTISEPETEIRQVGFSEKDESKPKRISSSAQNSQPHSEPIAVEAESGEVSETEQEQILWKDIWTKNSELQRWRENGMKNPNPVRDVERLKRQIEMDRLNMTSKEAENAKKNSFDYSGELPSHWRWVHKELEQLSEAPTEKRPSPEKYLRGETYRDKKYLILRANAAILMGRDGDPTVRDDLLRAVKNKDLRVEVRCAAVEALGKMPTTNVEELIALLDDAREKEISIVNKRTGESEQKLQPGITLLWGEILESIAEKISPWENDCFLEPLAARSGDVRLAAAKIWRLAPAPTDIEKNGFRLPEEYLDFARREADPTIRIEILRTLGAWKEPNLYEMVRADLTQGTAIRSAAMDALAEAGCVEAVPMFLEKLKDIAPRNRAKAVDSLRKLKRYEEVFKLAEDPAWEVREQVARAIAEQTTPRAAEIAKKYLNDYEKIQRTTLDSLASWPLIESGPLLLEAMRNPLRTPRIKAKEILASQWPEAKDFDVIDAPKNQAERFTELVKKFEEFQSERTPGYLNEKTASKKRDPSRYEPKNPMVGEVRSCLDELDRPNRGGTKRQTLEKRLVDVGGQLIPILEYLHVKENRRVPEFLDEPVLAKVDPVFAMIVKLDLEELDLRRRGAAELAAWSRNRKPGILVSKKIYGRGCRQTDPLVLGSILETLGNTDPELACSFSVALLDSESGEIRRKACIVLKKNGDGRYLAPLIAKLDDPDRETLRDVLEAIATILGNTESDEFTTERRNATEMISNLLLRNDPYLQADAAATLHVLGNQAGSETIRRLSVSPDASVRQYVAKTISNLEDPIFVPIMIRFLNEENSIRQVALTGLPKIAGRDIGEIETGETRSASLSVTKKKIMRWTAWAEKQEIR